MTLITRSFRSTVAVAALAATLAACSGSDDTPAADTPTTESPAADGAPATDGPVTEVTGLSQDHVEGIVEYPNRPPFGGPHNPVWQNCGAYSEPVVDELAVHSMEHGAVWIAYNPELDADTVSSLAALAEGQTHVLVSPYPDLGTDVVASAWGVQQRFGEVDTDKLAGFLADYQQGPQTPELGAPCTRGVGEPE